MTDLLGLHDHLISAYRLTGPLKITEISIGLIHATYLLESPSVKRWVIQGLHPLLCSPEILEDYDEVTAHLARHNYGGPQLIRTASGARASEYEGRLWRLSTFVEGETYTQVMTNEQAYCGGLGIARFHRTMQSITYQFRSAHPGHDTRGHLQRLIQASQEEEYQAHWEEIKEWGEEIIDELSETLLPDELPRSVVHGDPKISNLRFQDGHAVMIDLDTCNIHTRLVDLGDAIRSWCHQPDASAGERFMVDRCQALIEGYLSGAEPLTDLEEAWLPRAGRVITLELASRFALDYLKDHYFAYDQERFASRRKHNKHRVQMMCWLAREMHLATPELSVWLRERVRDH